MSCELFVTNIPPNITLEYLAIYFQSSTKSGGGDVYFDACKLQDGGKAIIVFEERECLDNVLKREHVIDGYKLGISEKKFKPVPKTRKNVPPTKVEEQKIPPEKEEAYLGEVRTVIVSGLCADTTDEIITMFFEHEKRSGGGPIEKVERCEPGVAHITFESPEVAAQVLKHGKFELDGYLLQLKEKQPELILPRDRKKLYVENIDPKTTNDSLTNYMEARTKLDVCNVQFGDHKNAIVTFNEEPDMKMVLKNFKLLEGATLGISNPPVCNSILVTGFNTGNTTKQAIEMYFENENKGGGKIYGDVIYQKDQRKAVVSFCNPEVVQTLITRKHKLNDATLSLHQHYQFMNTITETSTKIVELNADVLDHIIKTCEQEFSDQFGIEMIDTLKETKKDLTLPKGVAEKIEGYLNQFTVKEVPFCEKLLDSFKAELETKITKLNNKHITITIREELLQVKLVGKENDLHKIHDKLKSDIAEMEQELNVATEQIDVPKPKLELLLLHDVEEILKNEFHVDVKIEPPKKTITIKGIKKQVFWASKKANQICNHINEDSIDLTDTQKRYFASGMLDVINSDMKASELKGMISLNELNTNRAKVFVFDGATINDVQLYLKNHMFQKEYVLDEESLALLKSNKWKEFCSDVEKNSSVMINAGERTVISLIGKKSEVKETFKKLQKFMKRNTIVNETIGMNEGYVLYLNKYCKEDLKKIETRLEEQSVTVNVVEDEGTMTIGGTKDGVKEARKYIEGYVSNIATDKLSFEKQRMHKYLKSEEGRFFVAGIESNHKCLIRITEDDGRTSANIPPIQRQPNRDKAASKLLCSFETQEKISFKVYKGDITAHHCDVIVNAANEDLQHIGGVAKSILDAGGQEIQKECDAHVKTKGKVYEGQCFSGSPGKLPCKRLIHAVGPHWDSRNREKVCNILRVTCTKVLEEAMSYQSIALPAISSGVFGVPKDVCADIMIRSAEEFSKKHSSSALKEIHFVNNDEKSGQAFARMLRERFGGSSSFRSNHASTSTSRPSPTKSKFYSETKEKSRESDPPHKRLPSRKPEDFIVTKEGIKISVVVGDLSKHKADVLVNTTGENLNLDSNPCSSALSKNAGSILQAECDKIGKLKLLQVAVTQGGNLPCDEVYHVVCVKWNNGEGEEVLRSIIKKCLKECNSRGKQSIAFPAIGTGVLGFPHDEAAKIFFEEAKEFGKRVSNCSIKEVSFVVFNKDARSVQSFINELKKQPEWGSGRSTTSVSDGSQKRWKRSPGTTGNESKGVMCIEVGENREIEIVRSDITKETTQVIAHLTNPSLFMGSGVATALAKAGGQEIQRECDDKRKANPTIQVATTVLTTAGRLNAKYIAHMVAPNGPSSNEIEKCIRSCLKTVSERGCESVSFPAIGTGSLNHDPEKAATTILTPIIRFLESSSGPLTTIRIVLRDDEIVTAFQTSTKKFLENEGPGMFRKLLNLFWKSESAAVSVREKPPVIARKLFLEIFGENFNIVNLAKEKILNIIESKKTNDKLDDDNVEKLSKQQIAEIEYWCKINDVEVDIEKVLNRIILFGHSEDVARMSTEIFKILKKIGETEKEMEKAVLQADLADIVSQGVQWYYEDPATGNHEEYHKHTNGIIEKAYSKNEKSVIFLLDNERCEIVFSTMKETNLDRNKEMKVIRKDLKAEVCVPDYWEPQPRDTSGRELAVHLVPLNPNDPKHKDEYKNISDHFNQTAREQILAIHRVQNPSLFKLYSLKKQSLDEKNGSHEKFLFHGTNGDKVNEINEHGLNRSFAGNTHGARFGKGVYFARDASMSAGYAPANMSTGNRYMYFTRVAIGEYTVGAQGMLVPPPKGGRSNDSFDSVVNNMQNPTIFVLFYDNQYYPEYLITFN